MIKKQRAVWYLGELEDLTRIVKDGFPPEPDRVECLVREIDAYQRSEGKDTPHCMKIMLKGYVLVPKGIVSVGVSVQDLNKGTHKLLPKLVGVSIAGEKP